MQEERIARTITARTGSAGHDRDRCARLRRRARRTAAVAAARQGARVALIERYNHLGGLATGGLVLVLPHFRPRAPGDGLCLETRTALLERGIGHAQTEQRYIRV